MHQTITNSIIYTRFSVVGFHQWVQAPDEVGYLRQLHRHVFEFKVTAYVHDHDRELEFHILQRQCRNLVDIIWPKFKGDEVLFGQASCEHIATTLASRLHEHGVPVATIEVNEDGENGAIIAFTYSETLQ